MSYANIINGLHARFATVAGIRHILAYEPRAIHETPLLYSLLDTVTIEQPGQIIATRYRILHRLCFKWQDNERAELELMGYVDAVVDSLQGSAGTTLDGTLLSGIARISDIEATFVSIGGTVYRCLDIYSDILEKRPHI